MYPSQYDIDNYQRVAWKISWQSLRRGIVVDPCVFKVPHSLSSVKPEAYSPQLVGLTPNHRMNPQLWHMERVKLDAAVKIHLVLKGDCYLDRLVHQFRKLYLYICGCCPLVLVESDLLLAQMMVVDALFLFGVVCLHGIRKTSLTASNDLRKVAELSLGKKLWEDEILKDVMMLENQIPIFIMEKMLIFEWPSNREIAKDSFPKMLLNFCGAVSPFKNTVHLTPDKALKRAHLLDLLYHVIVPTENLKDYKIVIPEDLFEEEKAMVPKEVKSTNEPMLANIAPPIALLGELLNLPVQPLTSAIESVIEATQTDVEDIIPSIPTASSLSKLGITFGEAMHMKSISFHKTTKRFQLPVMKLRVNSEVIIRNLVAYEALIEADDEDDDAPIQTPDAGDRQHECDDSINNNVEAQVQSKDDERKPLMSSTGLVLARHMELMNKLIDTVDDVQVLKDQGIIISDLKNKEIATFFSGMSKSIELSDDSKLDQIIKDIGDVYNRSLKVRCSKLLKRTVYPLWKILLVIVALCYLVFLILQAFCNAYNCPRIFKSNK